MMVTVHKTMDVILNLSAIRVSVPVKYGEEDMPLDYPFRRNNWWAVVIDIGTGQIRDWPAGVPARRVFMKVTDAGNYEVMTEGGEVVAKIEQDYVPSCIPGEYGDYIDFYIDDAGRIVNWKPNNPEIFTSFFREED